MAHEDERRQIAEDIHDSIGSQLSVINFKMESFFKQLPELSEGIFSAIKETMNETRRIQMDLHPSILDDLGIVATLSWFCRRFQTNYSHIRIEPDVGIGESEVPKPLKTVIYRISQEALNNIAKHSKAGCVCLSLQKIDNTIQLTSRDDGQGFDLMETAAVDGARKGLGLTSMKNRAQLSGGCCTIESIFGKGTVVRASWPIGSGVGFQGQEGIDVPAEILRNALDALFSVTQKNWVLEEDAIPTLQKLRETGYKLAITSNAGDDADVQQLARGFGITKYFDFILTSAACSYRKPHPRIFELALSHWYCPPEEAVMVGDNLDADVRGSQNIGAYGIWISRRAHPDMEKQEQVTPDASMSSLLELPSILDRLQVK